MARDKSERRRGGKPDRERVVGQFVALPHVVLKSPGWLNAGHVARSLLIDIAQQYMGTNNGKLVACDKYLKPLGWRSHDVVTRALRELVACGLLVETRKGARPNRAAWFALAWVNLHQKADLDIDAKAYTRGGYMSPDTPAPRNERLIRARGIGATRIAPQEGERDPIDTPSCGAMPLGIERSHTPSDGGYLEKPSGQTAPAV